MDITIEKSSSDQRFDRFLRKYFKPYPEISLTDIFSRIRKGAIKVNHRKHKQDYRLQLGDNVSRDESIVTDHNAKNAKRSKKEKIKTYPLDKAQSMLLYENEHRLIFNKPAGIVMHPGTKHGHDLSLHDVMKSYLHQTDQLLATDTFSPSFCFRLDKDTSGIVIAAKTYAALQSLNEQIRERKTEKTYIAVVAGKAPDQITIEQPLFKGFDRASGKAKMFINKQKGVEAKTQAKARDFFKHPILGDISLVEVQLYTGRMHQIRIHMAHVGLPIIGDISYGNSAINRLATKKCAITRQLLHSRKYGFSDILDNKRLSYESSPPKLFTQLFMNS